MATYPQPTTELSAINTMLGAIGMAPLNSLNEATSADVITAKRILSTESLNLQSKGWHFNTENDYPLTPNGSNEIILPTNIIRVDLEQWRYGGQYDVVQRGTKLYDRLNRTYTFTTTLKATVVLSLPFEELPQPARWYVTVRSARRFQDELVGDESQHQFKERDEFDAWATFQEFEGDTADWSIFSNYDVARVLLDRGGPLY